MKMRAMTAIILSLLGTIICRGFAEEKSEIPGTIYSRAHELIAEGNRHIKEGQPERAYCRYESAMEKLKFLQAAYPEWNRKKVSKQMKEIVSVQGNLQEQTCRTLAKTEQGIYRFRVLQRQAKIMEILEDMSAGLKTMKEMQDEHDDYLLNIRSVVENIEASIEE